MASRIISLLIFLLGVAVVSLFGSLFSTGDWYEHLRKPVWTPPSWLFGPVWTALYVLMAIAAWQVWEAAHAVSRRAVNWWWLQLLLNGAWSWVFFGLHRLGLALIEMAVLWLAIFVTMHKFHRVRPGAALLLVPYLVWVSFAWLLNLAIWWMNGATLGPI